ncbi:eight-cysteine-cluster domain-containing protein [Candidatus Woesearchaeota archaeon]|nr:eight-cysteine-cluster domain-containing protein [Candidatus Woesearchaeota archaeon]
MKKIIFICLLILVILISGCAQEKPTQEDKFVKDLIAKEEGEQLGTIELVEKCIYKDQTIYHLVAGCCDFFNGVYNKNSDKICSTGGLTGRGDGKCPDFFERRKNCELIWEASSSQQSEEKECITDTDCGIGGCSGQICGQKDKVKDIITICEWREEYDCYRKTACSCVDNKCQWEETSEFLDCIASKSSAAVIT